MGRMNVIMVAVALTVLVAATTTASASKADVNIFNEVGQTILLHCHSGHSDLGEHQLLPGGKYGWGFTPSFLSNTLYWCHFGWGAHSPSFDVWKDSGLLGQRHQACVHCEWHARPTASTSTKPGSRLSRSRTGESRSAAGNCVERSFHIDLAS